MRSANFELFKIMLGGLFGISLFIGFIFALIYGPDWIAENAIIFGSWLIDKLLNMLDFFFGGKNGDAFFLLFLFTSPIWIVVFGIVFVFICVMISSLIQGCFKDK